MPVNLISMTCVFFAIVVLVNFQGKDASGRGFLGRLDGGTLNESDRFGLKLVAALLGAATIFYLILG